jgi:hypothetical protein
VIAAADSLCSAISEYQDASNMLDAVPTIERRGVRRQRTLFGASISYDAGFMSGHILNISETGALVRPAHLSTCPNKFILEPRFESPRNCEVAWRKGEVVGVRFVG